MELLLTVEQAAERLQLAPFTVREHLKSGKLRGIKRGRVWRIPETALQEEMSPPPSVETRSLARALELVAQLERDMKKKPTRRAGKTDAAAELRALRKGRAS